MWAKTLAGGKWRSSSERSGATDLLDLIILEDKAVKLIEK